MARNKFDVDEKLESPFQWSHLKMAGKYVGRHKYKMLLALVLSGVASVAALYIPKITQWVLDEAVPNGDTAMIGRLALTFVGIIALGIALNTIRSRMMVHVSQQIITISGATCLPTCRSFPLPTTTAGRRGRSWCG